MKVFVSLFALGLLALALLSSPVEAQYYQQQYQTHQQTRRIVRVHVVEVAQINPAYTSAYSPDSYDTATQAQLLLQIQALTRALQQQIANQQAPAAPVAPVQSPFLIVPGSKPGDQPTVLVTPQAPAVVVPPPPATVPTAVAGLLVLNTHCAVCHTLGKLAPNVPFGIVDAKGIINPALTADQKRLILIRSYKRTMPPVGNKVGMLPVTDADYASEVELLE
jgi:mono/diheme cytochrome c family protein